MDKDQLNEIRKQIKELVGEGGAYVLMLNDGKNTQAWADGDSRLKMRGLLETGYDIMRDMLNGSPQRLDTN